MPYLLCVRLKFFQHVYLSYIQVLTTVRQRVDHFSYTVQNFEELLLRARRTLAQKEGLLPDRGHSMSPSPELNTKLRAASVTEAMSKGETAGALSLHEYFLSGGFLLGILYANISAFMKSKVN